MDRYPPREWSQTVIVYIEIRVEIRGFYFLISVPQSDKMRIVGKEWKDFVQYVRILGTDSKNINQRILLSILFVLCLKMIGLLLSKRQIYNFNGNLCLTT